MVLAQGTLLAVNVGGIREFEFAGRRGSAIGR